MTPRFRLAALALLATALHADVLAPSTTPIDPNLATDTILSTAGPRQFQQYIGGSEFSRSVVVFGLQVRLPDGANAWPASDITFASFQIYIGQASFDLVNARGIFNPGVPFANNLILPDLVYSGPLVIPAGAFRPGDYGLQIRFNQLPKVMIAQTGYVIWVIHSGGTPASAGGEFSTVMATSPEVSSAVMVPDNTSPGWGVNGQVAAPYVFSLVTPRLANVSTRAIVGTDAKNLIGGFIVQGPVDKRILVRAIGPSLAGAGVPNTLADPQLIVHDANNIIASNDNWGTQAGGVPAVDAIKATGLEPVDARESAILLKLSPGGYTAQVRGAGGSSGNALVEVFDLDSAAFANTVNLSTRADVQTGDSIAIAGFQIRNGFVTSTPSRSRVTESAALPQDLILPISRQLIIRGIGPSLTALGVSGALPNPTLALVNSSGQIIASNDDWESDSSADLIAGYGLAPSDSRESALMAKLPDGDYTCLLRGAGGTTGVGLIEVFDTEFVDYPDARPGAGSAPR